MIKGIFESIVETVTEAPAIVVNGITKGAKDLGDAIAGDKDE